MSIIQDIKELLADTELDYSDWDDIRGFVIEELTYHYAVVGYLLRLLKVTHKGNEDDLFFWLDDMEKFLEREKVDVE